MKLTEATVTAKQLPEFTLVMPRQEGVTVVNKGQHKFSPRPAEGELVAEVIYKADRHAQLAALMCWLPGPLARRLDGQTAGHLD